MDTVTLDMPATTRDGLRAQAAQLDIAGRGAMNKAQLQEAVSAEITRRVAQSLVDGTDDTVSVKPTDDGYQVTVPATTHGPVVELNDFPYVVHGPAPEVPTGTRVKGHKGTGILRTRTGRLDYPASKRARKGGRK